MRNKLGFTLIEVMIVLMIIALLASIAAPAIIANDQKKDLIKAGYSELEADSISRSNSVVVAEAIKRKKTRLFTTSDDWGNGSVTVTHKDPAMSISLPIGSTVAVEGKWYTFTWAGSKWMALSDGSTNIVVLFIFEGDKLKQMPSFGR